MPSDSNTQMTKVTNTGSPDYLSTLISNALKPKDAQFETILAGLKTQV